jgi:hypothetical protein
VRGIIAAYEGFLVIFKPLDVEKGYAQKSASPLSSGKGAIHRTQLIKLGFRGDERDLSLVTVFGEEGRDTIFGYIMFIHGPVLGRHRGYVGIKCVRRCKKQRLLKWFRIANPRVRLCKVGDVDTGYHRVPKLRMCGTAVKHVLRKHRYLIVLNMDNYCYNNWDQSIRVYSRINLNFLLTFNRNWRRCKEAAKRDNHIHIFLQFASI